MEAFFLGGFLGFHLFSDMASRWTLGFWSPGRPGRACLSLRVNLKLHAFHGKELGFRARAQLLLLVFVVYCAYLRYTYRDLHTDLLARFQRVFCSGSDSSFSPTWVRILVVLLLLPPLLLGVLCAA